MAGIEIDEITCENCASGREKPKLSNWNCVPVLYPVPSVARLSYSRTSSSVSIRPRRHYWRLLIMLLALFQVTEAYITVSMNELCSKRPGTQTLKLSPAKGTSLQLETSNSIHQQSCKMELIAPDTHSISLLFTRRKQASERTSEISFSEEIKTPRCPLIVSFPILRPEDEVKMSLDLCSETAFKGVEQHTDLLPPHITLEWIPTVNNTDEILASEIVLAAVGRGREVCSQSDQYSCGNARYPVYCIAQDLVCDGKKNCPFEGSDEDKILCQKKSGLLGNPATQNWEFIASEFIKKLSSNKDQKKNDQSSSTEKSTVLWSDDGSIDNTESLPDVLNHYGPWGYLMLGMLICGTVLMFCGLWECCCRRPKAPVSTQPGPTLLIINQGAQQSELEIPQTPGPPRYEDLDQPPSYAALFPSSKPPEIRSETNSTTNTLPITIPIVDSLSNLLTNSTSSQTNSSTNSSNHPQESRSHPVGNSGTSPDVYTIDSAYLEIRRDASDNDSNVK